MKRSHTHNSAVGQLARRQRSGALLAEVLIAILVMGVGVISLMALFPISVIRSVQGHQMTVATGQRLNIEAMLDAAPYLWADPDRDGNTAAPAAGNNYLVDPLWYATQTTTPVTPPFPTLGSVVGTMSVYSAGYTTPTLATPIAVYDNSWIDVADEVQVTPVTLSGVSSVTLGTNTNVVAAAITPPQESRIILYDVNGRDSVTRTITAINTPTAAPMISWTTPVTMSVARIRIETKETRFSWVLTCRRHDVGTKRFADIYVTEFFRREIPKAGTDPVYSNPAGFQFPVNVTFQAGQDVVYLSGYTETPTIRRGGWVLDAQNGYWYRIADFKDNTGTFTVRLERKALANSNAAVFMRGVVDVYYIGTKEL